MNFFKFLATAFVFAPSIFAVAIPAPNAKELEQSFKRFGMILMR